MTKKKRITLTPGDGFDRIEWFDADGRKNTIRANDPKTAERVLPTEHRTRRPGKGKGQKAFQGRYWCAGSGAHVFHESMLEYTSMMLLDHLYDIVAMSAQPMLLTFADGDFHYPDFLAILADGTRLLMDAHSLSMTTVEDERKFELTKQMCERLGWRYLLLNEMSDIVRWNLEYIARFHHPRFTPEPATRNSILSLAANHDTFGGLMDALRTEKLGEHIPALFHLFWKRALALDITTPITPATPIWVA